VTSLAEVRLWGRTIGAVSLEDGRSDAAFQYAPEFVGSGIELSPIVMPLSDQVYTFPSLPRETFHGLPGLLADSLPDRFGNMLIDAWLMTQGRRPGSLNAVERLCYTGSRGMGALEFVPETLAKQAGRARRQVDQLV
jgi:serine/threonine-protein kinase HipA